MILVWAGVVVVGLTTAMFASRRAVEHASAVAFGTGIPPFVIGITLVSIGTDLPEIANSIVASASGNGDVNVGDSIGSAATQLTLVLGLLPFVGSPLLTSRRGLVAAGLLTAAALGLGGGLVADGFLGRPDAFVLLAAWVAGTWVIVSVEPNTMHQLSLDIEEKDQRSALSRVLRALFALLFVAGGASLAVWGVVEIAEVMGVPAYIISFFGASLGTSLPELVVAITAVRRGQTDLAVGDAFGASLVDSTLSIGIGPAFFPTLVTASLAVRGSIAAAVIALMVTLMFSRIPNHDRRSGLLLLIFYGLLYAVVL